MRLAPRFVIAFGLLASASTAGLGLLLRDERRQSESVRFDEEVQAACKRVASEVKTQADTAERVLAGACNSSELVDRTLMWVEAGDDRRVSLGQLVRSERERDGVDELVLVTGTGDVLAADPPALLALPPQEAAAQLAADPGHFVDGINDAKRSLFASVPSIVSRCKRVRNGVSVGLLGGQKLDSMLAHVGTTVGIAVKRGSGAQSTETIAQAECAIEDGKGGRVPIVASKNTTELQASFAAVDRILLEYCGAAVAAALIIAILLARGLSRPLSNLADEARKVASGEARPVRVRGSGEIADLTSAFDRMLDDLAATRRRLAATTRVAAWREVARRVAHEVKNPLAPIRAAVETLRRLRAREDPAFNEYFDEATRTVLNEVKRIADIVTEFTRFARLPPPKPRSVDLVAIARDVVKLHEAGAGKVTLRVDTKGVPPVMADGDQIVQVLTNLVQNAIDVMQEGTVRVVLEPVGGDRVAVSVRDEGPGVSPEMVPRLFEPYATSKAHGTGLGLAIAQRIAIEHGGELSYVPHERGAEFRLVLPIEGPPPVSEMPVSA
jgi:two-component system, NtrC family, nitrogen regulation sensor histidine kinase NtrY